MDKQPQIRLLLLEDDRDDYLLLKDLIEGFETESYHLDWVSDFPAALKALEECDHDLYLVDYRLVGFTGIDFITEAMKRGCSKPLIMLTGQREREIDVLAMQAGAVDFLIKDQLDAVSLERTIRYAIRQKKLEEEIHHANQQLEERVAERTAELARINEILKTEISERNRMQKSLLEIDQRKNEFLATLAHELRNPLAPISAALQIMALEPSNATQVLQLRDMMDRQVAKLTRLIDDLLDVSRISQGKMNLRREPIALKEVIDAAIEIVQPLIETEGHALSISILNPTLVVNGDKIRLSQVLSNLLVNAAKYTPRGGRIELSMRAEESGRAVIHVRDNGIGISPPMLAKIFEMFTQVDGSSTRAQGGLGIGLTLVKTLVEMHGGSIEVQSEGAGRGSTFMIRLPVMDISSVAIQPPPEEMPAKPLPSFRVLVVDDNEPAAYLLSRLLQKLGQEVETAHSATVALEIINRWKPEIVISDIAMPAMSGYELAKQIRSQSNIKQPFLIALTGYGKESDHNQTRNAGFDEHLTKPVDIRILETLLAELPRRDAK